MKPISIGEATNVYDASTKCEITRHWVDHAGLRDVSCSLRSFVGSIRDEAENEFWQTLLAPIRRLGFALVSTPLPFDRAAAATGIAWGEVERQVRLCQHQYPDAHTALATVTEKLRCVSAEPASPLAALLETLNGEYGRLSVVLRNPRMNHAVASYFVSCKSLRNVRLISASQLRHAELHDVIVAFGPCGWFPEYMFCSPRATRVHVASFSWLRDSWRPHAVFLSGSDSNVDKSHKHYVGDRPLLGGQPDSRSEDLSTIELHAFSPPYETPAKSGTHFGGHDPGNGDEIIRSRLCYLIGGRAVFVSSDEGSSSLVIDLSETGDSLVRRVAADHLEPEQYLLLRTSGGGDLVAPLADHYLGSRAQNLRAQQAEWKSCVIAIAQERFGLASRRELAALIADAVRTESRSDATPAKVYYWMSSKCIRPRKEEEFAALLAFGDMRDRAQELWLAMKDIDRAHRIAGHAIRRMLLQKIASSSLDLLERDGEMVFHLGDQEGGTLSAFRIERVSAEELEIDADRIGILLDLDR